VRRCAVPCDKSAAAVAGRDRCADDVFDSKGRSPDVVRRPSIGVLLLGLVPFAATCFSVSRWDRVHPMVLGLPFNFRPRVIRAALGLPTVLGTVRPASEPSRGE
jgi:hypothetical protein